MPSVREREQQASSGAAESVRNGNGPARLRHRLAAGGGMSAPKRVADCFINAADGDVVTFFTFVGEQPPYLNAVAVDEALWADEAFIAAVADRAIAPDLSMLADAIMRATIKSVHAELRARAGGAA